MWQKISNITFYWVLLYTGMKESGAICLKSNSAVFFCIIDTSLLRALTSQSLKVKPIREERVVYEIEVVTFPCEVLQSLQRFVKMGQIYLMS